MIISWFLVGFTTIPGGWEWDFWNHHEYVGTQRISIQKSTTFGLLKDKTTTRNAAFNLRLLDLRFLQRPQKSMADIKLVKKGSLYL